MIKNKLTIGRAALEFCSPDRLFIFYHISEVYRVDNYKLGKFKWMFISITYIHVYSSNQNLI